MILWNSVEIYETNPASVAASLLSSEPTVGRDAIRRQRARLMQMLESHFRDDLIVMRTSECASLLCLRQHVSGSLKLVEANGDQIAEVVKTFSREGKEETKSQSLRF